MTDFGTDISTEPDLDAAFAVIDGPRAVFECLARRLRTPRGALPFCPDDGLDLSEYLHEGLTSAGIYGLKARIEDECLRDERVLDAQAELAFANEALDVTLIVELAEGPFRGVLRVTALDTQILQFE